MNKAIIIGNLTRDPELRTVSGRDSTAISVCDFTVAVNRRNGASANGQPEADFFRVTAWRGLADNCKKYLAKGRKVAVTGAVSCRTYTGNDGITRANLEIQADEVEFLTPRQDGQQPNQGSTPTYQNAPTQQQRVDQQSGFVQVEDEELPF